jgi:DNA polymerase-4
VDVDAFFASVEQRDDPRLRGKPVAVGSGVVASCSYEARRYGVRTAMRMSEARRLCPQLIVVPGQYLRYEQVARQLFAVCCDRTPLVEAAALDDLYLDVTASHLERGEEVARTLLEQVRAEIGISLSIGVGGSKLVSAVATREVKEAKCRVQHDRQLASFLRQAPLSFHLVRVPRGQERDYLAPWPVAVLPGAGAKVRARLDRLNVHRVGQVAAMPPAVLQQMFGAAGRCLHEYALGRDHRQVVVRRPVHSISRRTSFDPPVGDEDFLGAMLDYLVERAASWIRFQGLAARGLSVLAAYGDYALAQGRESLPRPTQQDDLLKAAARERFHRLYQRRLPLRLLGVELAPLQPAEGHAALFPDPQAERQSRLCACKDAVRRRFGFTALLSGNALWLAQTLDRDRANFRLRTSCLTR